MRLLPSCANRSPTMHRLQKLLVLRLRLYVSILQIGSRYDAVIQARRLLGRPIIVDCANGFFTSLLPGNTKPSHLQKSFITSYWCSFWRNMRSRLSKLFLSSRQHKRMNSYLIRYPRCYVCFLNIITTMWSPQSNWMIQQYRIRCLPICRLALQTTTSRSTARE